MIRKGADGHFVLLSVLEYAGAPFNMAAFRCL